MRTVLLIILIAGTAISLLAQEQQLATSSSTYLTPSEDEAPTQYTYDETLLIGQTPLIKPEKAQLLVNLFRSSYPDLGSPRFLIHVNRKQVDDRRLIRRLQLIDIAQHPGRTNITLPLKLIQKEVYGEGVVQPTTVDPQTAREVEILFSRPLRAARAIVLSERSVNQLLGGKPMDDFISFRDMPKVRAQREVLSRGADVIVEILISFRVYTVSSISGNQTVSVPQMSVTAIQLRTGKIIGQATSWEVAGHLSLARLATFDVRQMTEATAMALMRDMALNWRETPTD